MISGTGESDVWRGAPYKRPSMVGAGRVIGIGMLILFVELPILSIGLLFGSITWLLIGLALIAATVYFGIIRGYVGKSSKLQYVLTNRRAIVSANSKDGLQILQQVDLRGSTVSVLNKRTESTGRSWAGSGYQMQMHGTGSEVGDVVFMKGGARAVSFENVPDPEGIRQTAQSIIVDLGQ